MPDSPLPADHPWIHTRQWSDGEQTIHVAVDGSHRACVHFEGKGSVAGAKALVKLVDDVRDEIGEDVVLQAIVDMRRIHGTPLRAQFIVGKWLFKRKKQLEMVATFGGKPLEMKIARAVMAIARMKNAGFFGTREAAIGWLGWPDEVYPV